MIQKRFVSKLNVKHSGLLSSSHVRTITDIPKYNTLDRSHLHLVEATSHERKFMLKLDEKNALDNLQKNLKSKISLSAILDKKGQGINANVFSGQELQDEQRTNRRRQRRLQVATTLDNKDRQQTFLDKLPDYIERQPSTILRLLSRNVKSNVDSPPTIELSDDPFLIPLNVRDRRDMLYAHGGGRQAAKYIIRKHPNLFIENRISSFPDIKKFTPTHLLVGQEGGNCVDIAESVKGVNVTRVIPTVDILDTLVEGYQVEDAMFAYQYLIQNDSLNFKDHYDVQFKLLQLLAFFNDGSYVIKKSNQESKNNDETVTFKLLDDLKERLIIACEEAEILALEADDSQGVRLARKRQGEIYATLIQGYHKHGGSDGVKRAFDVFVKLESIRWPEGCFFRSIRFSEGQNEKLASQHAKIDSKQNAYFKLDVSTYNTLINVISSMSTNESSRVNFHTWEDVTRIVLSRMKQDEVVPDHQTCFALLNCLERNKIYLGNAPALAFEKNFEKAKSVINEFVYNLKMSDLKESSLGIYTALLTMSVRGRYRYYILEDILSLVENRNWNFFPLNSDMNNNKSDKDQEYSLSTRNSEFFERAMDMARLASDLTSAQRIDNLVHFDKGLNLRMVLREENNYLYRLLRVLVEFEPNIHEVMKHYAIHTPHHLTPPVAWFKLLIKRIQSENVVNPHLIKIWTDFQAFSFHKFTIDAKLDLTKEVLKVVNKIVTLRTDSESRELEALFENSENVDSVEIEKESKDCVLSKEVSAGGASSDSLNNYEALLFARDSLDMLSEIFESRRFALKKMADPSNWESKSQTFNDLFIDVLNEVLTLSLSILDSCDRKQLSNTIIQVLPSSCKDVETLASLKFNPAKSPVEDKSDNVDNSLLMLTDIDSDVSGPALNICHTAVNMFALHYDKIMSRFVEEEMRPIREDILSKYVNLLCDLTVFQSQVLMNDAHVRSSGLIGDDTAFFQATKATSEFKKQVYDCIMYSDTCSMRVSSELVNRFASTFTLTAEEKITLKKMFRGDARLINFV